MGILEATTEEKMPRSLVSFLSSLVKKGQYIADDMLTELEIKLMNLDAYWRI